eukprot:m.321 g.321  ORF g.321 m.321 type:complete len:120 (+) comp172_c0_seq1:2553-2912(+)
MHIIDLLVESGIFRELVHQYRLQRAPDSLTAITSQFLTQLKRSTEESKQKMEEDLQWIMIQVWNFGVECYSRHERQYAKSLCSFSMEVVRFLPQALQQDYGKTMANSFASIITKRTFRT